MLSRPDFANRFGPHALIGMVHLRPLPGSPLFWGSLDALIEAALADAMAIAAGGGTALMFENFGDRPFHKNHVEAVTIAAMTRTIAEVVRQVRLPFGVNVLRNDAAAALAIAAATGASFIRVNVHTGAMLTDQGIIEGRAAETLRLRASLAPEVAIFADHFVKHAVPLAAIDPVQSAKDLRLRGLADALIVTGAETGAAPDVEKLAMLRSAVDAPLLIGSGLSADNAEAFADADGAIVGTAIKRDADVDQPVASERLGEIAARFRAPGGR
jgi:membrane complex biogenesis BtpA family protein